MAITGKCYCGEIAYQADGDPIFKAQCHCRECQHIAGGSPNLLMGVPADTFSYTKGQPKQFSRSDLDNPVTREFCGTCGTHLVSLSPRAEGVKMLKVGSLDDPSIFENPQMVFYTSEKQDFHILPEDAQCFEKLPG